jgi:hypothetical protein
LKFKTEGNKTEKFNVLISEKSLIKRNREFFGTKVNKSKGK